MICVKPQFINIISNLDCVHFQTIILLRNINKKLYYE